MLEQGERAEEVRDWAGINSRILSAWMSPGERGTTRHGSREVLERNTGEAPSERSIISGQSSHYSDEQLALLDDIDLTDDLDEWELEEFDLDDT